MCIRDSGYVLRDDGRIAGYMCVDFGGDPAYDDIRDGGWGTKEPYAVVHRMTFDRAARGRGLASRAFSLVDVYKRQGNASMRELLGGKGANLAEMTNIGLPVPQGFTVTTEACTQYYEDGRRINDDISDQIME